MNKILLLALLSLVTSGCEFQKGSLGANDIEVHMRSIDQALIQKDTLTLSKLLHDSLSLGHSNGWLETKPDLLHTLIDEGVIYTAIEMMGEPEVHSLSENLITTRRDINVSGVVNETPFDVRLNVLEVWINKNKEWQLLARQSVNRRE